MARSRLIAGKRSSSRIDTGALSNCIDQLMNISSITPSTVSLSQDNYDNFDLITPAAAAVSSAHAAISTNEADTPDHCGFSLGDDTINVDHGFGRAPPTIRKRFVGVRQRPSGRWVAEIKDTVRKIRLWLGTFNTAEEAARAYDEAACLLRGTNTRTNFMPSPDRIVNYGSSKASRLLHLRLNHSTAGNNIRKSKQLPNTAAHSIDLSSSSPPHPSSNLTSHYGTETCLSSISTVSDHAADQIPRKNELKSDHYGVNLRDYKPISALNDHEINYWDHKLMKPKDYGNNNGDADYCLKSGHNGIESNDYELNSKGYVHNLRGYRPSSSFPDPNVQEIHHEAIVPKGDEIIQDYTVNSIQLIPYLPMFNHGQVDFNVNNEHQIIKNTVSSDLQDAFSSLDHEEMFYPSLFELAQEVAAVPAAASYHHLEPSDHDYQKAVHSYEEILISPKVSCQAHDQQNQQHPQDSCDHSDIDEELDLRNGKSDAGGGLEESMKMQESLRGMNYERQGSASLYTMNGVTECFLLSYNTSGRHFSMSSPSLELPASFQSQCNTNWSSQKAPNNAEYWTSHQIVSSQHRSNQEELEDDDDEVNLASSSSCSPQHSEIDHELTTSRMATNHNSITANHELISSVDRAVLPPINNPSSNIMLDRQQLLRQSKISPARVEHSLDQCSSAIPEALWNSWNLSPLCT